MAVLVTNAPMTTNATGYRWYSLATSADTTPSAVAAGVNDGVTNVDVALGAEKSSAAYEAAGFVWTNASVTITQATWLNGTRDASYNGVFAANFGLQFSTNNGAGWFAASGWTVSPNYPYNAPAASGLLLTATGTATTV